MGEETVEPVDAPAGDPVVAVATVRFPYGGFVVGDLTIGHDPVKLTADQLAAVQDADTTNIVDIEDVTGEVI